MSGAIGKGDLVRVIRDTPYVARGEVRTVARLAHFDAVCAGCKTPGPGVYLSGVQSGLQSFCTACEVHPINGRAVDVFRSLLTTTPADTRELVDVGGG